MKFEELKQLCDSATPGPWNADYVGGKINIRVYTEAKFDEGYTAGEYMSSDMTQNHEADNEFIAAARTALPLVLKALELACVELYLGNGQADDYYGASPDYWLQQAGGGDDE